MAPRAGLEPATNRLTVCCTTIVLPRNNNLEKYGAARGNRTQNHDWSTKPA